MQVTENYNFEAKRKIWRALQKHAARLQLTKINDLIDDNRASDYTISAADLYFDYAKNLIDEDALACLFEMCDICDLPNKIAAMFAGEKLNITENRKVLHTALRAPIDQINPSALTKQELDSIASVTAKIKNFADLINSQKLLGATNKPIKNIINLGIGGSDLGPKMVLDALSYYKNPKLTVKFVGNIDPQALDLALKDLNPENTLFIVASKTFTTQETLSNALLAKNWILDNLKINESKLSSHFIAVTASPQKAIEFGIDQENIFEFWDWVGGRFSLWSAIGLPIAIGIGYDNFAKLLAGANKMDDHFLSEKNYKHNIPVILALIGIWNNNFLGHNTQAVIPYLENLKYFPEYLQQLEMESNGKAVSIHSSPVAYPTAPILWGQTGTNSQHAFFQLLHQGTHIVPVDFIMVAKTKAESSIAKLSHQKLLANCLAQGQALMQGYYPEDFENNPQAIFKVHPGNKPSNNIVIKDLTPEAMGSLIALYEHKTFVQGVIWDLNSFDQPGVEYGKKLANQISDKLSKNQPLENADPATCKLYDFLLEG